VFVDTGTDRQQRGIIVEEIQKKLRFLPTRGRVNVC
jgi:hypothetical protein